MLDYISIKLPNKPNADYDYLAFSFNGYHSWEDLGIIRVSDGNRYNENITPEQKDKTSTVTGVDGIYFFGTKHKQKIFNIKIAFERLTEEKLRLLKKVFDGKDVHPLWFAEAPYKVYEAKITGRPKLSVIPFDSGDGRRHYNGEGTLQFTAYYPYARTPDAIVQADGRTPAQYSDFGNYAQWEEASGLNKEVAEGWIKNVGQLPSPFVWTVNELVQEGTTLRIGEYFITTKEGCKGLEWNSKTGMVVGTFSSQNGDYKRPLNVIGKSVGTIPIGGLSVEDITRGNFRIDETEDELTYHYWYY